MRSLVASKVSKDNDGILENSSVFVQQAKHVNIITDDSLEKATYAIINVRNGLAHGYPYANRSLDKILSRVSSTDCLRLFWNAFNSIKLDNNSKLIANQLLYDLFTRDNMSVTKEFKQLFDAYNVILQAEIDKEK